MQKNKTEDTLEDIYKRLDRLEKVMEHIHGHLEYILENIGKHDERLTMLGQLLLSDATDKELDNFLNPNIDYLDIEKSYTPISDRDKKEHEKRFNKFHKIDKIFEDTKKENL